MKALVGTFNQEKALVGAFSVIVEPVVEPMELYTALVSNQACFQRVGKTPYGELTGGEESDSSSAPEHRIRNQHRWVLTRALNEPSRSFPSKNI